MIDVDSLRAFGAPSHAIRQSGGSGGGNCGGCSTAELDKFIPGSRSSSGCGSSQCDDDRADPITFEANTNGPNNRDALDDTFDAFWPPGAPGPVMAPWYGPLVLRDEFFDQLRVHIERQSGGGRLDKQLLTKTLLAMVRTGGSGAAASTVTNLDPPMPGIGVDPGDPEAQATWAGGAALLFGLFALGAALLAAWIVLCQFGAVAKAKCEEECDSGYCEGFICYGTNCCVEWFCVGGWVSTDGGDDEPIVG